MSSEALPWEKPAKLGPVEVDPLLDSTEEFRLSELDISPNARHRFSAGKTLAVLHSIGLIHGDLHPDHLFYNPANGITQFIDFDGSRFEKLSPQSMVIDFVVPYTTFESNEFLALLAGYTKSGFTYLDSCQPGYTVQFLRCIGAAGAIVPKPRESNSWVAEYFRRLGIKLAIREGRIHLSDASDRIPLKSWNDDLERLLVFLCGLIVAGLDISVFFQRPVSHPELDDMGRHFLRLFFQLYSRTPLQVRQSYPSRTTSITASFLKILQDEIDYPEVDPNREFKIPANQQPDLLATAQLFRVLVKSPKDSVRFVDGIIDVSDHLATHCDSQDQSSLSLARRLSIDLAQHSFVLLSNSMTNSRLDECRLLTEETRHHELSWMDSLLEGNQDFWQFAGEFAYTSSKCNALMRGFSMSIAPAIPRVQNGLWSSYWEALHLSRNGLLQCSQQIGENSPSEDFETQLNQLVSHAVGRHFAILKANMTGLMAACDFARIEHCWTGEKQVLMREVQWTTEITKLLKTDSVLTEQCKALFKKGEVFLK